MTTIEKLNSKAEAFINALDDATGHEHHYSKTIRRFISKKDLSQSDLKSKFLSLIDHDEGLLNSADNELIQLCYPQANQVDEAYRIGCFTALLTAKTELTKTLLQTPVRN